MTHKIGYIVSRFPHLPETFILREMDALERDGWKVCLYPLITQTQTIIHDDAKPWIVRAKKVPFISFSIFYENICRAKKDLRKYFTVFSQCVMGNISSIKFLVRAIILFPKSVYLASLMEKDEVEHIHAHYATHPALAAWIIQELTGIGYTITVHAHDIFVERVMLEEKLKDATIIRAISKYNQIFLTECYGEWVREKTHVVHCGINPSRYQLSVGEQESEVFSIISIGSLQEYKGFPFLIEACSILRNRGIPVHCKIIGGGIERKRLERLVQEFQLDDTVELIGSKTEKEVASLLLYADCYAQPSIVTPTGKMEGIPVSLMEALACGLPAVSSKLSGIPELIINGETGYLVPPADALSLADALENVFSNIDLAKAYGKTGRSLVLREFDVEKNVRMLIDIFEQELFNT